MAINKNHEFEELGGADDGVRNPGCLDQVLLRHLGAQVAAVGKTVGADDRQRDVMSDAGGGFGGEQVAPRRLEELQHGVILE